MPKFTIRVSQRVFYDVEIEAESFAAGRAKVHASIVDGDLDDEADLVEVDNSDYRIEALQTDENGDAVVEESK